MVREVSLAGSAFTAGRDNQFNFMCAWDVASDILCDAVVVEVLDYQAWQIFECEHPSLGCITIRLATCGLGSVAVECNAVCVERVERELAAKTAVMMELAGATPLRDHIPSNVVRMTS